MRVGRRSSVSSQDAHRRRRRSSRAPVVAAVLAALALAAPGAPALAQQVVAVVNGAPITSYDIEQRTKLEQLSTHKTPSRKEVLDTLINEKLKLIEAKKYSVGASDTEVNQSFAGMAKRLGFSPDQLTKALASHGITTTTLKARIRADLSWSHLVRGRYQASLEIGDRDIEAALNKQPDNGKDSVGYIYTLRPILLIVQPGSPPAAYEARRREADSLRSRFDDCERGIALAHGMRDVAVRNPIIRNSAQLPEKVRTELNGIEVGHLTSPDTTAQGVELFAVCQKRASRAVTPKRQEVRQEIFAKRYEAQSKRYLDQLRRSAMIEYK